MRIALHLYAQFRPEIESAGQTPSVFHAGDFAPVTAANPGRRGEILGIRARNLGPTTPAVVAGQAFPAAGLSIVNAPVEVLFNGKATEAINQVGWPNEANMYRVDFRVPDDAAPGRATVRLSAAWITGPEVTIPVQ